MKYSVSRGKLFFPDPKKELSLLNPKIKKASVPPVVTIPLLQHAGLEAIPLVKPGQKVCVGTKIARPGGEMSAAVHSSVSGIVTEIGGFPHPLLGEARAVRIESDGKETPEPSTGPRGTGMPSRQELLDFMRESGIVGMGSLAGTPAHVKLDREDIHTVIVNGAETEPYLTCDYLLMMERALEIVHAARIFKNALGLRSIYLAVGRDKLEALETVRSKLFSLNEDFLKVVPVSSGYPQGEESLLLGEIFPDMKDSGRATSSRGIVILNVATALAVFDAVRSGKPLYERVVTVTGECVVEPKNLLVKIGTSLADLVKSCKGILRKPGRTVMGGPMTGVSVESMDVPVIKGTRALIALAPEDCGTEEILPCIRCGRCVEACPAGINPCLIALGIEAGNVLSAKALCAGRCIECGNCSFVCPARRPMLQWVAQARKVACHAAG